MNLLKPPPLRPGDTIGVVAPAGAVYRDRLDKGVRALQARGFRVELAEGILARKGYLAGSEQQRARTLERFFVRGRHRRGVLCPRRVRFDTAPARSRPRTHSSPSQDFRGVQRRHRVAELDVAKLWRGGLPRSHGGGRVRRRARRRRRQRFLGRADRETAALGDQGHRHPSERERPRAGTAGRGGVSRCW